MLPTNPASDNNTPLVEFITVPKAKYEQLCRDIDELKAMKDKLERQVDYIAKDLNITFDE